MKALLGLLIATMGIGFQANAGEEGPVTGCSDVIERASAYQFHRYLNDNNNCFFSALPMDGEPFYYHYRSYLFTDKGTMMVFNSYEKEEVTDGARVFMIFPRNRLPSLEVVDGRPVMKSATEGVDLILHEKKSIIYGMNGGTATEDYTVSPKNAGGVELSEMKTLIMDAGFTALKDPTSDLSRKSTFKDIKGNSCTVKNSEVFKNAGTSDTIFKFNDKELKTFLGKRCPQIFVNW